ncbi:MAG: dienelactone hydrolase family protein [Acidobacteriota bacterium]
MRPNLAGIWLATTLLAAGLAHPAQEGGPGGAAAAPPPASTATPLDVTGAFDQPPLRYSSDVWIEPLEDGSSPSSGILRTRDRIPCGRDRVAVDIFQPSAPGRYPAVVLLHGTHGPGRAEKYYLQNAEALARSGFVALFLRYYDRGRKGRGNRTQWTQTIEAALTYAATLPNVDGDRMALLGFSQGAFLALNDAPSDPRIRAVVAYYGGLSPGFVTQAKEAMPPTLLFHGTSDRIVPVRRSLQTLQWLREEGRPADLVVYTGAGHGFCLNSRQGADRVASDDSWRRTLDFLNFHLRYPGWAPAVEPWRPAQENPPAGEGNTGAALQDAFAQPPLATLPYLDLPEDIRSGKVSLIINPGPKEIEELVKKYPPRKRPAAKKSSRPAARPKPKPTPAGAAVQAPLQGGGSPPAAGAKPPTKPQTAQAPKGAPQSPPSAPGAPRPPAKPPVKPPSKK